MTVVRIMTLPSQRVLRPVEVLPPVELTTDRLLFRPLALSDRLEVVRALVRSRGTLAERLPLNRDGESDDDLYVRWVETAVETDNNRSSWRRAAFLEDGRFVGLFNLIRIQFGLEWACEANWWVDRRMQGRGLASEGVEGMLHFATADLPVGLGLNRVRAMIQPDNLASLRVAEKAGMTPTGEIDLLEIAGSHRPHVVYERRVA